jgi:hypothetical protein
VTRRTNARIAGIAYLLYIAVAFPSMVLSERAARGEGIAAQLASFAQHATDVRVAAVLTLLSCFCALILAVTLYAITRDQDPDLAMLALTCRVTEGVTGAVTIPWTLGLLWFVTTAGTSVADAAAMHPLGAVLIQMPPLVGATFFAVGSALFSWLLLRGRMVPLWLAWLGVLGSALIVVGLPLQMTEVLTGSLTQLMWIPVAVFELVLAVWLIVKGVATPVAQ